MSFDWHVSFGQLIVSVPIFWVIVMLMKMHHLLLRFRIEHEILMNFWAESQNPKVKLHELPTRMKTWW